MIIIGVDFHPEFQQIASVDTDSGESQEQRLQHREEAEKLYRSLAGKKVRVGIVIWRKQLYLGIGNDLPQSR